MNQHICVIPYEDQNACGKWISSRLPKVEVRGRDIVPQVTGYSERVLCNEPNEEAESKKRIGHPAGTAGLEKKKISLLIHSSLMKETGNTQKVFYSTNISAFKGRWTIL
jgi:hypothetical protein